MSAAHLQVVILAAGASRRMGSPKQLLPVAGKPALAHVVSHATAVCSAVSVVLGAEAARITPLLQHSSVQVLINRQWQEGIAASIRCAIQSLPGSCDAVLLLLGDQLAVSVSDLRRLINAWNGQDSIIAASVYQGQFGVPAIFPRLVFSELSQLRGDQGAKRIIQRHASRVTQVPMASAAHDLDTPDDVAPMIEALAVQKRDLML